MQTGWRRDENDVGVSLPCFFQRVQGQDAKPGLHIPTAILAHVEAQHFARLTCNQIADVALTNRPTAQHEKAKLFCRNDFAGFHLIDVCLSALRKLFALRWTSDSDIRGNRGRLRQPA